MEPEKPASPEAVEITPKMIAAGLDALCERDLDCPDFLRQEEIVLKVFSAMKRAEREAR